jgi:hypothetical protein
MIREKKREKEKGGRRRGETTEKEGDKTREEMKTTSMVVFQGRKAFIEERLLLLTNCTAVFYNDATQQPENRNDAGSVVDVVYLCSILCGS